MDADSVSLSVGDHDERVLHLINGDGHIRLHNPTQQLFAFIILQGDDDCSIAPSTGAVAPGENIRLAVKCDAGSAVHATVVLLTRPIALQQVAQLEFTECELFEPQALAPIFSSCGRITLTFHVDVQPENSVLPTIETELGTRVSSPICLVAAHTCTLRISNSR